MTNIKVLIGESASGKTFYIRENIKDKKVFLVDERCSDESTVYNQFENQTTNINESGIIVFDNVFNLKRDLKLLGDDIFKNKDIYLVIQHLRGCNIKNLNTFDENFDIDDILVFKSNYSVIDALFKKYHLFNDQKIKFDCYSKKNSDLKFMSGHKVILNLKKEEIK